MELAALQAQLERERGAAAERAADHADALGQLDAARQRAGALEMEVQGLQREALEARAELGRQAAEHEAAQAAAAARITGAPLCSVSAVSCLWLKPGWD